MLLFQFGVGIAVERDEPWERYVRSLHAPVSMRLVARIATAILFSMASIVPLAALGAAATDAQPSAENVLWVAAAVFIGGIPFGLFGIAMGYWVHPRGALAVTNLVYLPLSFLGGLFQGPDDLPDGVRRWAGWVPTRVWNELIISSAFTSRRLADVAGLAAWTVVFAVAAAAGYRRDQGRHYR